MMLSGELDLNQLVGYSDMRPVALCDAHTYIYRRQPLLVALAVCNSPVKNRTIFADGSALI